MIESLPVNTTMLVSTVNMLLRDGEFDTLADLSAYYEKAYREETHIVSESETAANVGSGLLPVYATPQVVALMEHTACEVIAALPEGKEGALSTGDTTVGTRMAIDHVKACKVGDTVCCTAMLATVNGRQYDFLVEVRDSHGAVLAKAEHTRFLVNADRFMSKLG